MDQSNLMPERVNKISVLRKMIGLDKKKPAKDYVVPNNSALNFQNKTTGAAAAAVDPPISQIIENTLNSNSNTMNKCPHCENMAKNFLYLESLIRNNSDKGQKCNLCASSLKYLQYVNRNIMQVFGNTESIARAARSFSRQPPPPLKYSVAKPQLSQKQLSQQRAKGGAVITRQKSAKNLKPKPNLLKKSKSVVKSLKSNKSSKSLKSLKSVKSAKSSKSLHKAKVGGGGAAKSISPKSAGSKNKFSHGKMALKRKYRMPKQISHGKMARSASQYHSLGIMRSKLNNKAKKQQKQLAVVKKRKPAAKPISINWSLLKRNMPKRLKMPVTQ